MRSVRVVSALLWALLTTTSCTGASPPGASATPAATTTAAAPATTWATTTTTTTPPTTATLPRPAPLLGEAWPALPLLDVAEARDGDLMIAGPDGVMLVRDGEPLGLLHDEPTQVAVPDGIRGLVYQTPFRIADEGNDDVWWLPGTGGREYVGISHTPLGSFRLQQVEWVPRLGRYEDGAWTPTANGLTALFGSSDHGATGVLVTTGDPDWITEHWEITLPGPRDVAARTWTGRHLVEAIYGGEGTRLDFLRVDGQADVVPHNPRPDFAPGWVGNLDSEPGSPLLAYTTAATREQFGIPTHLHVVDLTDGRELLSLPIAGEDEQVVRLDLHGGVVAISTRRKVPGGISMGVVRLVDLDTGRIDTLPWGGTASLFYTAAPLPASSYPAIATAMPELVVTAPMEAAVVNQRTLRFEGYATPGALVTAAGRFPVAVDAEGHWSTSLTLNPGGNVAIFAAAFPGGPAAETARVVFRVTSPELGYTFDLRYERGDPVTWVAEIWVHDTTTRERLAGAAVTLGIVTAYPEVLEVTLLTDDLGRVTYRIPQDTALAGVCLRGLDLEGYPSPPTYPLSDLPAGSIACEWATYP